MNVVRAPNPWITGMSETNWTRGARRPGAGSARKLAIISSVTSKESAGGVASGAAAGVAARGTTTGNGVHRVTVQTPREIAAPISATPSQASGSQSVLTKTIQITSPVRAAL